MADEDEIGVDGVVFGLGLVLPDDLRAEGQRSADGRPILRECE
jgi:hypothetical protein